MEICQKLFLLTFLKSSLVLYEKFRKVICIWCFFEVTECHITNTGIIWNLSFEEKSSISRHHHYSDPLLERKPGIILRGALALPVSDFFHLLFDSNKLCKKSVDDRILQRKFHKKYITFSFSILRTTLFLQSTSEKKDVGKKSYW